MVVLQHLVPGQSAKSLIAYVELRGEAQVAERLAGGIGAILLPLFTVAAGQVFSLACYLSSEMLNQGERKNPI